MLQVLDYSSARLSAVDILAAGYPGAVRYLRRRLPWWGTPLTAAEVLDFREHAVDLAMLYQADSRGRILEGFAAGADDARWALAEAEAARVYVPRCIYFVADRDLVSRAEIAAVLDTLDGAASVLGRGRVGVYGEYDLIEAAVPAHATFGMQCVAWSHRLVSAKARLLQLPLADQTHVAGVLCDRNNVLNDDWGQLMPTSQNGWPTNPPRSRRQVPGTGVWLTVADGPAGDVLLWVLSQFDKRVEDLDLNSTRGELDDWGHADRPIRDGVETSNHASATAVDANATRHPLGVRGTFTRAQVDEIHRILAEAGGVVRWGGDYTGRADEMHFEINATPSAVATVAARLTQQENDVQLTDNVTNPLTGKPLDTFEMVTFWTNYYANRIPAIEAKLDALAGALSDDEANLLAAIRALQIIDNDPDQVMTDEQLQQLIASMPTAVVEGIKRLATQPAGDGA